MLSRRKSQAFFRPLLVFVCALFLAAASPPADGDVVRELLSSDPLVRKNAIDYFNVRPKLAKQVAPNVLLMLDDPEPMVRDSAAICLGRIREETAYEPIVRAVRRGRLSYNAGAYALGRFGRRALPEMIAALESKDKNRKMTALRYLTVSKDPRAVEPLIAKFRTDRWARLILTLSFQEMGPVIQPPLIKLLSDPDGELARAAADALGRMNDPLAEDALELYREITASR